MASNTESTVREFTAHIPEGCWPETIAIRDGFAHLYWAGNGSNLSVEIRHGKICSWSGWKPKAGSVEGLPKSWANEIPAELMKRIEEFKP